MTHHLKHKYLFITFLTAVLSAINLTVSFAQTVTPGNFDAHFMMLPSTGYIQTLDSLPDPQHSRHIRIGLGYAFLLNQKTDTINSKYSNWSMNINANYSSFNNEGDENRLIPTKLLYSELGVVHFRTLKNRWAAIQTLSVGVNTDFRKVDDRDLIINAGFIFMKRYNPNLSLGFGLFSYNTLSMPVVLPGFVIQWQTSGKFKVLINIPTEISGAYMPQKNLEIKLAFRPKNINYDTENPLVPSRRALSYWELPIGLEVRKKYARADFMIGGGLMALRSFQFNERGLDNFFKSTPGHMLKANYFLNVGIQFHLQQTGK